MVGVADAQSETYIPVTLLLSPHTTISQLKDKVSGDYGFHPSLQRWVIGKRLAQDAHSLFSHGVRQDGDQAYLYIMSAQAAHVTRHSLLQDQEQQRLDSIMDSMYSLTPRGPGAVAGEKCVAPTSRRKTLPPVVAPRPKKPLPQGLAPGLDTLFYSSAFVSLRICAQLGWSCGECTYVNKPTRPGCEMCGGERPAGYQIPEVYLPDHEETHRIQQEELAMLQYRQALEEERVKNFQDLLETDGQSLVPNPAPVDCPICFCSLEAGEGATLRDCLHSFCRDCLKGTIVNSQDAEITCPYGDDEYSCNSMLQDREIQALLSPDEHRKFLELRLSIAESRSEHSFHCQTPDCPGWCIYEDQVNQFDCELCKEANCILCKAIHKDMNCKEYQDDLRIRAENDQAANQTNQMLQGLLQNGEAMRCPRCEVIVQKKDGCDWLCCLMCKTEICWVTRQARWGPKGKGDTSGGCKCRVNGKICHPNCQNCH
ncbi:ranBP-type and C3HC4-type zinc finger-containing protein 1-like [Aplochiton taeniatus]